MCDNRQVVFMRSHCLKAMLTAKNESLISTVFNFSIPASVFKKTQLRF